MSYRSRRHIVSRRVVGLLLFAGILVPAAIVSAMIWTIGRCDSDGSCIPLLKYLLLFPGLLIGAVVAGVFVVRWVVKDDY